MNEIKAKPGCFLTQADESVENRIFVTIIKGVNVKASDWRDATEQEKETFEAVEAIEKPLVSI